MVLVLEKPEGKAKYKEIELVKYFPKFQDLLSIPKKDLAIVILKELIEATEHKKANPGWYSLGIQLVKYHNPELKEPKNMHIVPQKIKDAITDAWNWLGQKGYIRIDQGQNILTGYIKVTEEGLEAGNHVDTASYVECNNYSWEALHPEIKNQAEGSFRQGDYNTAIFNSFKKVEISLRETLSLGEGLRSKELIGRAFSEKNEKLNTLNKQEIENLKSLFEGAMERYRHPIAHKDIDIGGCLAFHQLMLASLLLKELDVLRTY